MHRMALVGKGGVTYLSLNDNAADVMNRLAELISHLALTDLVVGRPIVISGRYTGKAASVRIGETVDYEGRAADEQKQHREIAAARTRHKITDLNHQMTQPLELAGQIKQAVQQTALNHNVMSFCTAFIAVDSMTKTDGNFGTTVAAPVLTPKGAQYETTIDNGG